MSGYCCLYGYVFWWGSSFPGKKKKKKKNTIQHYDKRLVFIDPYISESLILFSCILTQPVRTIATFSPRPP